ncbi:MGMT family protein [bacterium]|nr:MGMT family protein [bacterium]
MPKKLSDYINPLFSLLISLPKGKIISYSIAAKSIGLDNPRNIGWILKQNKNPDTIPCFKVVLSNGKLAKGYKFGGQKEQQKRLKREGIFFDENGRILNFEQCKY